ncbi:MAG: ATPase, T2SS/T4P/T4SS family, partial [archaeon]
NIVISGGTSSGKTTLLNVLCSFIPANERVISIEDTSELNLPLRHWIRLEGRPPGLEGKGEITLDILTKNSLRMRPDRIIVGEVRHDEAFSLFTAMNTGHDGSCGTIHANSAAETLIRITSPPMSVPEVMLSGLNFVIVENLFHSASKGSFRRITEIAEVLGVLEGKARTQTVFAWDPVKDELERMNVPIKYLERLGQLTGMSSADIQAELKKRERFLQGLLDKNIHDMKTISSLAQDFLGGY